MPKGKGVCSLAFFKQKKVAVVVCCLLVLLAVLFGSHRSLGAVRRQALQAYAVGDDTGLSILANLNSACEYANTLLRTASGYYPMEEAPLADVLAAVNSLRNAQDTEVVSHRQALADLLSACTLLQADYGARSDIPEEDVRLMERSINDIISMKDQMRHSAYNEMADAFNRTLDTFPAGLLAGLTGIQTLPLF